MKTSGIKVTRTDKRKKGSNTMHKVHREGKIITKKTKKVSRDRKLQISTLLQGNKPPWGR